MSRCKTTRPEGHEIQKTPIHNRYTDIQTALSLRETGLEMLTLLIALCVASCTSAYESSLREPEMVNSHQISTYREKIQTVTLELYSTDPLCGYDDLEKEVATKLGCPYDIRLSSISLRSSQQVIDYQPSRDALNTLAEMAKRDPSEYTSKSDYCKVLLSIVSANDRLTPKERKALEVATYVVSDVIEANYGQSSPELRAKWWDSTKRWCRKQWDDGGKCAAGIVGGSGLAALEGASIGSAIPGLGTTAGAIIGGISGGLTGAAAAC